MTECPDDPSFAWYHIIITTYGAWLDGDARGFRTRHHREHVEGDYKAPPPRELYAERRQWSLESLKQPAVSLAPEWRPIAGAALVERFQTLGLVFCRFLRAFGRYKGAQAQRGEPVFAL